jgi:HD superfamily phosphohydrolase
MEFQGMEEFVIDVLRARELQRLRRIRQLGLAHLVFPGAEHSRFTHSLGAAYTTSRFADALRVASRSFVAEALQPDEQVCRDLVLAGVCHDVGHGPLSHVWERHVVKEFEHNAWRKSLGLPQKQWITNEMKWHELVTQALLLSKDSELHDRLENMEKGASERIASLVAGHYYVPHLARLFDSDVDVDRCDFIIRDAYQTGVAYGRFDLSWLVSTITIGFDAGGDAVIGFDKNKGTRVVEQLLIARRALYDTVYFHRAVRGAERMFGVLFDRLRGDPARGAQDQSASPRLAALTAAISREALSVEQVVALDDFGLTVFLNDTADAASDNVAKDLARRIVARDLFKAIPIINAELDEFVFTDFAASSGVIENALRKCGYTEAPDCYQVLDRQEFSFFEDSPQRAAYFVDTASPKRHATPISQHEELAHHRADKRVLHWLFVPADAVRAVTEAIRREQKARRGGPGKPETRASDESA